MSDLHDALVKLGSTNPELRPHIRPLLAKTAGANWQDDQNKLYMGRVLQKMKSILERQGWNVTSAEAHALISSMKGEYEGSPWYIQWNWGSYGLLSVIAVLDGTKKHTTIATQQSPDLIAADTMEFLESVF